MGTCAHRAEGRWGRIWDSWLAAAVVSFAVIEATGMTRAGVAGTLSAHLRRIGGLEPECRHRHLGRAVILSGCGWAAVHLGWGVLGVVPGAHR